MSNRHSHHSGRRRWAAVAVVAGLTAGAWMGGCTMGGSSGGRAGSGRTGGLGAPAPTETGEFWTIQCTRAVGPDHRRIIDNLAAGLRNVRQLDPKAVWTQHEAAESFLYYGRYHQTADARSDSPVFPPEYTRDIQFIRILAMGSEYPFARAMPVSIAPNPVGPQEWDVRRAPGDLTLQVAVFFNEGEFQQRMEAAVEYVKYLRDHGIEAYYYHGNNGKSIVCAGHFDKPAGVDWEDFGPDDAKEIWPQAEVLIAKDNNLQYNLVNGCINRRAVVAKDGSIQKVPYASFLIRIPRDVDPTGFEGY